MRCYNPNKENGINTQMQKKKIMRKKNKEPIRMLLVNKLLILTPRHIKMLKSRHSFLHCYLIDILISALYFFLLLP